MFKKINFKKIFIFFFETSLFLLGIPIIIIIIFVGYSALHPIGMILVNEFFILKTPGESILFYQAILSPFLIRLFRLYNWKIMEFWSVVYLTIPLSFIFYGRLRYEPGDEFIGSVSFLTMVILTFIYYEWFYKSYCIKNMFKIPDRYNLKELIESFLKKNKSN